MQGFARREFLKAASAAALGPVFFSAAAHAAGRVKITNVKLQYLKVEKEIGSIVDYLGRTQTYRIGGGNFCIVETDAGISGIGSAVTPAQLPQLNRILVGKDPFDMELNAERLKAVPRAGAAVEVALWDLIGKLANQPLYKLWGGGNGRDFVTPYSSHFLLETPKQRGAVAAKLKAKGWRAMKVRAHFPTLKDDIALAEEVRKQAGDDFVIMVDGNKANVNLPALNTNYVRWDYRRAYQTAKAYEALNVYWLEEPFPRFELEKLARLQAATSMNLAGGEANQGLNEFKDYIDRDCYRVIQPEVLINGVVDTRKIIVMAEASGRQIGCHLGDGRFTTVLTMHLSASCTNYPFVEMSNEQPLGTYENSYAIFESPPVLRPDGTIKMSDAPGLGLTVRKELFTDTPSEGGSGGG